MSIEHQAIEPQNAIDEEKYGHICQYCTAMKSSEYDIFFTKDNDENKDISKHREHGLKRV